MHGIVPLVLKKTGMVATHNVVRFDALSALSPRIFRPWDISLQYRETGKADGQSNQQTSKASHGEKPKRLFAHAHINISGRADIGTDMTTDTAVIVSVDVTSGGVVVFLYPEDCILRAINHAVVTLEA